MGGSGGRSSWALRATLPRPRMVGSGSHRDVIPGLRAGHREAVWEDRHCPVRSEDPSLPPQQPRVPLCGQQLQGRQRAGLGHDRGPLRAHPHRAHAVSHLSPLGRGRASLFGLPGPHHQSLEGSRCKSWEGSATSLGKSRVRDVGPVFPELVPGTDQGGAFARWVLGSVPRYSGGSRAPERGQALEFPAVRSLFRFIRPAIAQTYWTRALFS